MLWSQYKLAMMRLSEFLHKQITRIPNFANRNFNFRTFHTSEFLKQNPTRISGIKNEIGILLPMGVPDIGTKNWNSQPRATSSSALASAVSADWDIASPLQNVRVDTQFVGIIEEQKQQIKQLQEELAEFNCVCYRTLPANASRGKNILRSS